MSGQNKIKKEFTIKECLLSEIRIDLLPNDKRLLEVFHKSRSEVKDT